MLPSKRWTARLLVLLLHALLLTALWLHRPARHDAPRERTVTALRLIAPRPSPPAPPPPPEPMPRLPRVDDTRYPPPREPLPSAPEAEPSRNAPSEIATLTEPIKPIKPAEPGRSTLRLSLPPGYTASAAAARNPALSDPRSNTARMTLEDRIADATGGAGAWIEESSSDNRAQAVGAQGDRRTVFRRGDTCVESFKSRTADVDPFNASMLPTPRMWGKPYKCR